jgi:Bacteriophage Sf6, terminase small subunit-like
MRTCHSCSGGTGGPTACSWAGYTRVVPGGYHTMADEILDIVDDSTHDFVECEGKDGSTYMSVDHEHIQRSKLRYEARKWLLE